MLKWKPKIKLEKGVNILLENIDLWKRLKELTKSTLVEWCWIKGHSGDAMNDLADKLAKEATPI